jgi:hypothetical protein
LKLTKGLNKRHAFDIADSATQLNDAHFWLDTALDGLLCNLLYPFLNGVRNVWNN